MYFEVKHTRFLSSSTPTIKFLFLNLEVSLQSDANKWIDSFSEYLVTFLSSTYILCIVYNFTNDGPA